MMKLSDRAHFTAGSFRSLVLIPVLVFLVLTGIYSCRKVTLSDDSPGAVKGLLDLRDWDFDNRGGLRLDGEWEFYWKQLLTAEDFTRNRLPVMTGYFEIPGAWNGYETGSETIGGGGYATYSLTLRIRPGVHTYALRVITMSTAYRLFVDGEELMSNGTVGTSRDTMIPHYQPKIASFTARGDSVRILLQISNYHHRRGGPWNIIELGTPEDLRKGRELRAILEFFLFVALFIMGLYHFILYLFRRKDVTVKFSPVQNIFTIEYLPEKENRAKVL